MPVMTDRDSFEYQINYRLNKVNEEIENSHNTHFYETTYVNAYERDRAFGGHEEGGWWFEVGEALCSVKVRSSIEAMKAYEFMVDLYGDYYEGGPGIGSVIHEGSLGIMIENHVAEDFPNERPHYE